MSVIDLAMRFGRRRLFEGLSFNLKKGDVLAITGSNGSGKSTLLRIICGLMKPSLGSIVVKGMKNEESISSRRLISGLIAPNANLYEGLTAFENLEFISKLRPDSISLMDIENQLQAVELDQRKDDFVSTFSSGMKQRLKLAAALISDPFLLIMDEPFSNLDEAGFEIFKQNIEAHRAKGLVILATNNADIASKADRMINIEDYPWEVDSPFSGARR